MLASPMTHPIAGQRILVTGATGLVGAPLCRALADENEVFAVARFSDETQAAHLAKPGITPVHFDLRSRDLSVLPENIDIVFHLGSLTPAIAGTTATQADYFNVNAQGSGRLM